MALGLRKAMKSKMRAAAGGGNIDRPSFRPSRDGFGGDSGGGFRFNFDDDDYEDNFEDTFGFEPDEMESKGLFNNAFEDAIFRTMSGEELSPWDYQRLSFWAEHGGDDEGDSDSDSDGDSDDGDSDSGGDECEPETDENGDPIEGTCKEEDDNGFDLEWQENKDGSRDLVRVEQSGSSGGGSGSAAADVTTSPEKVGKTWGYTETGPVTRDDGGGTAQVEVFTPNPSAKAAAAPTSGLPRQPQTSGGSGKAGGIDLAVDAAYRAGFRGDALREIVATAGPESGYNPRAQYDPGGPAVGENSRGFWQINMDPSYRDSRMKSLGLKSEEELYDPYVNARAAKQLYDNGGMGHWTAWKTGKHRAYYGQADDAIARYLANNGLRP